MKNTDKTMEKIVALCKGRGFVFSGSEIYGGLANTWDYGPPGCGAEKQCEKGMVEEVRSGEPLQRGPGRRHLDESPGVGGLRPCGRASPPDGL